MVTLLRLLPKSATDKDIEILTLRHQRGRGVGPNK